MPSAGGDVMLQTKVSNLIKLHSSAASSTVCIRILKNADAMVTMIVCALAGAAFLPHR